MTIHVTLTDGTTLELPDNWLRADHAAEAANWAHKTSRYALQGWSEGVADAAIDTLEVAITARGPGR